MESRLKLLLDYAMFSDNLGGFYAHKAEESKNEAHKNKYTFIAYSLMSIPSMTDLVIRGVSEKNNLLIFSGLRMIEENHANISYVFHDPSKTDRYIQKILSRGIEYQQAYTEIRNNPELGMRHLSAVERWSGSTITQRIKRLGEGPEFRYEIACKYLHSDIWTLLNNQAIRDLGALMYGQISWAIEDIQNILYIVNQDKLLEAEYRTKFDDLAERADIDFMNEPTQTYH